MHIVPLVVSLHVILDAVDGNTLSGTVVKDTGQTEDLEAISALDDGSEGVNGTGPPVPDTELLGLNSQFLASALVGFVDQPHTRVGSSCRKLITN